ncbi:MAG: glycosyltransferase family 2 protein [Desulfosalsimonas sp.]
MKIIFFLSILVIIYVYAGYPAAVFILGVIRRRRVNKAPFEPFVTVLIAAYNEKDGIADTVSNKLARQYPAERMEVLVVSDGSTDGTDEIVRGFTDPRVKLLRQEPRAGKTSALNMAVPECRGEVIVFSDANSIYAPDAISRLVSNFSDPKVGYATGSMVYTNPDGSPIGDGCTLYMKYENALRRAETRIGSIVGVDGGIDAVRKELYQPMDPDQIPDFVLPLKVVEQGYRVVYEPDAILREPSLNEAEDEYRMRVRVSLRSLWALFEMRRLLFGADPVFAWQLWSHKVLRYLCFIFLVSALLSNLMLLGTGLFYQFTFLCQGLCYAAALSAPALRRNRAASSLVAIPRYFFLLNLASAHAFAKFLMGKKQVLWTPRKG